QQQRQQLSKDVIMQGSSMNGSLSHIRRPSCGSPVATGHGGSGAGGSDMNDLVAMQPHHSRPIRVQDVQQQQTQQQPPPSNFGMSVEQAQTYMQTQQHQQHQQHQQQVLIQQQQQAQQQAQQQTQQQAQQQARQQQQQQQRQQTLLSQQGATSPNHAIASAAPVSSIGISSQQPPIEAWELQTVLKQEEDVTSVPLVHPAQSSSNSRPSLQRFDSGPSQAPISPLTSSQLSQPSLSIYSQELQSSASMVPESNSSYGGYRLQRNESTTSTRGSFGTREQPLSPSDYRTSNAEASTGGTGATTDSQRMQHIAKDILEMKRFDLSIMLPRHISQDHDELWVAPPEICINNLQGIPRQLLMLPKDANFLVDVYFE
ncbi:hypothetical protein BGW38_004444, partial [Lunasporangiospora selenospora]